MLFTLFTRGTRKIQLRGTSIIPAAWVGDAVPLAVCLLCFVAIESRRSK